MMSLRTVHGSRHVVRRRYRIQANAVRHRVTARSVVDARDPSGVRSSGAAIRAT
jgi:hypothetical protein